MKLIFLSLFFIFPITIFAQIETIKSDSITLSDGSIYKKGELVNIGSGSKSDKGYAFISTQPSKIGKNVIAAVSLTPGWEGYKMKIVGFQLIGSEMSGKKYYLILAINDNKDMRYICDPILAKQAKEIL